MLRFKPKLIRRAAGRAMDIVGEKLTVSKPVKELLFEGYQDRLLDIAARLNISGFTMDKFGWFYKVKLFFKTNFLHCFCEYLLRKFI